MRNSQTPLEIKINKHYLRVLVSEYLKKYNFLFINNDIYTHESIIREIYSNGLKCEKHLGSVYFSNIDRSFDDLRTFPTYALFFNVRQKYLYNLLHLLISIILPHQIYGSFRTDETNESNALPKIELYFVYPDKSKLDVLNIINNYIMLILSNISEEIIDEISMDCVLNGRELQCCERGSFPINKLMFLKITHSDVSDYDKLIIPDYEKKYYKYKYKYKALRIKESH
jgi:hypothetical protein